MAKWDSGDRPEPLSAYLDRILAALLPEEAKDAGQMPQVRQRIMQRCREVLEEWRPGNDHPAQPLLANPDTAARIVTTLLIKEAEELAKPLVSISDGELTRRTRRALPRTILLARFSRLLGYSAQDVDAEAARFEEIWTLALHFETAVLPRLLRFMARRSAELSARTKVFFERRQLSEQVIRQQACRVWADCGRTQQEIDYLLERIPEPRLRTYTDDDLRSIAENCRRWCPLVRFLQDPGFRGQLPPRHQQQLSDNLQALLVRLQRAVRARLRGTDVSDAVADALSLALTTAPDPIRGYAFEEDFWRWLFMRAVSHAHRQKRAKPSELVLEAPLQPSVAEYLAVMERYRGRFELVLTFFREDNHTLVRAIWEAMLDEADRRTDQELAIRMLREKELDRLVPVATIGGNRRRIRQRMDAVGYPLDVEANEEQHEAGDGALLCYVESRRGALTCHDRPTIRHLAALGRVAVHDEAGDRDSDGVRWARFARLVGDKNRSLIEAGEASGTFLPNRQGPRRELAEQRLARAEQSIGPRREAARHCRRLLRDARVGFLFSPCWYAFVLLERSPEQIIEILHLTPGEAKWVKEIVAQFQA